jgi:hypothetical protein
MKVQVKDCSVAVPSYGLESLLLLVPGDVWNRAIQLDENRAMAFVAIYLLANTLSKYEKLFCADNIVRICSILPEANAEIFLKFLILRSLQSKL